MKKIILLSVLFCVGFSQYTPADTRVVRTVNDIALPTISEQNIYKQDLSAVEEYLYGRTYSNDTLSNRFNRIEKTLFNRNFTALNVSQRMNNIIANYRKPAYGDGYYSSAKTPAQWILNRFIGQPTGFTPPVMNSPYNEYGMPYGINRGYYNNRGGYTYNNEMPASAGFGVHILD